MSDHVLKFTYTNWRGETAERRVEGESIRVHFGRSMWHPERQWLLTAFDLDKGEVRDFAVRDIRFAPSLSAYSGAGPVGEAVGVVAFDPLYYDGRYPAGTSSLARPVDEPGEVEPVLHRGSFSCLGSVAVEAAHVMSWARLSADAEGGAALETGEILADYARGSINADDAIFALADGLKDAEADRAADPRPSAGVEEALLDGGCGYPCGYDCNGACFPALAALPSAESRQDDDPRSDARELMVLCEYDEFARSCGVTSAARTLRIEELRARLRGAAS